MKTKIISVLIVLFWLGMMFTLVKDRILHRVISSEPSSVEPRELAESWEDQEEWMRILYKGLRVGAMATSIKKQEDRYDLSSRLLLEIRFLGFKSAISMKASATMDESFILRRFLVDFDMTKTSWNIKGLINEDQLFYKVTSDTGTSYGALQLDQKPSLLEAVRPLVGRRVPLKVGNVYEIPVYDPVWSTARGTAEIKIASKGNITLGDETYEAYKIETTLNNLITVSWVDEEGNTLMRQVLPEVVMHKASRAEIVAQYREFAEPVPPPDDIDLSDFKTGEQLPSASQEGLQNIFESVLDKQK